MKYLSTFLVAGVLASCASNVRHLKGPDPNDLLGGESGGISEREIQGLTVPPKKKRFSGELSIGFGSRL